MPGRARSRSRTSPWSLSGAMRSPSATAAARAWTVRARAWVRPTVACSSAWVAPARASGVGKAVNPSRDGTPVSGHEAGAEGTARGQGHLLPQHGHYRRLEAVDGPQDAQARPRPDQGPEQRVGGNQRLVYGGRVGVQVQPAADERRLPDRRPTGQLSRSRASPCRPSSPKATRTTRGAARGMHDPGVGARLQVGLFQPGYGVPGQGVEKRGRGVRGRVLQPDASALRWMIHVPPIPMPSAASGRRA